MLKSLVKAVRGNRTPNLLITNQTHCQLCYDGLGRAEPYRVRSTQARSLIDYFNLDNTASPVCSFYYNYNQKMANIFTLLKTISNLIFQHRALPPTRNDFFVSTSYDLSESYSLEYQLLSFALSVSNLLRLTVLFFLKGTFWFVTILF